MQAAQNMDHVAGDTALQPVKNAAAECLCLMVPFGSRSAERSLFWRLGMML